MQTHRIHRIVLSLIGVAAFAGPLAGVAQAASPTNTQAPAISGTAQVGQTLTYTSGTWDDATATVVDQWWSCNPGCAEIPGTTDNQASYTVQSADLNTTIEIHETATDTAADPPSAIDSTPVGPVTAAPPPPSPTSQSPPSITGTTTSGSVLTESGDTWTGTPTSFTWQWLRCATTCNPISNATASSYPLTDADVGDTIEVQMTASNSNPNPSAAVTSDPTATVVAARPTNTTPPSISGTTTLGQMLTETGDAWTNSPTSFTYQWLRCNTTCAPITGATSKTYTLVSADVGATIEVQMTAGNSNPSRSAAVTSTPTAAIAGATPTNTKLPAITGTTTSGQVLTEGGDTWTGTPTSFTWQWLRCNPTCSPIANATASTYPLTDADIGATIEVQMTASNANPTASALATSQPTAAILPAVPVNQTPPTITGSTLLGQVLTETGDTWTNSPTTLTYQWLRCNPTCTSITTNGISKTYTLVSADVGATIEVQMTASNANPTASAVVTSQPTATVVPPPPNIVAAPTISGTIQAGKTLTEGPARWGSAWPPTSTAVQWYRCDSNDSNCAPVGTGTTYALTDADVGATVQVAETATNAGGSTTNYSGFSNPVVNAQQIVPPPSANAGSAPTISGPAHFGGTLTASRTQFSGNPGTFSYQWMRCTGSGCLPIPGATDVTYAPSGPDVGNTIAVAETASNSGGTSDAVVSPRTDTITAPSTTSLQTSSHTPVAGQTVTLIATVSSPVGSIQPAGTVAFNAGGGAIPGCGSVTLGAGAPTAVCQTSFPASATNVTAAFSAAQSTFVTGSTSSATTLIVGRAATTLTVSPSGRVSLGSRTTYNAVVHPPASSLTPTGKVTFTDGGKTIKGCANKALTARRASCSVKYLGIKAHRISARYTGDANFTPSVSITSHVLVQPQSPKGFVTVYMNWTFSFGPHSTTIKDLSASGISPGIGLSLTCSGGGCPFKHHKLVVKSRAKCAAGTKKKTTKKKCAAQSSVDLTAIFGSAHLRVGTSFTVAITHSNWVGKYYRFTIRAGHRPSIAESCLAVDGTRPGVGCRA